MDIRDAVGNTLEMSWGNWDPNPFSHFYWGPNNTWIYTGGSLISEMSGIEVSRSFAMRARD
ncbi:MAG: hypothetical protein ACK56W_16485 [Pirellula sp.]|jgi:hypothetical protein